ncbi:MAG: hypothetical protein CL946_13155 [Ectothiorhodospiraceae bacterium]|nr:hypothetical protein [Ectothiorhodospiraceae bacterium]
MTRTHTPTILLAAVLILLAACAEDKIGGTVVPDPPGFAENQVLVEFSPMALNTPLLCYEGRLTSELRTELLNQRFTIDTLITNKLMADGLRDIFALELRRVSALNPCSDTSFITSRGDTIPETSFNTFLVYLDPDRGPHHIEAITQWLESSYPSYIENAEPNYTFHRE